MQCHFTRLPLRRCLHTQNQTRSLSNRWRVGLGLSTVVVGYLAWRLTTDKKKKGLEGGNNVSNASESRPFALDNPATSPALRKILADANDVPDTRTTPVAETTPLTEPPDATESNPSDTREIPPDHSESASTTEAESEDADDAGRDDNENGGAFDPVTGEINWDCPCLGGMAHGPCGPQFREAFSCFVFSEDEPKGINCVDKFKAMQTCFREHPDVYADEIMRDEEDEESSEAPSPLPVQDGERQEEVEGSTPSQGLSVDSKELD